MTRKHYEALADWARENKLTNPQIMSLMITIAPLNKLFDGDKFFRRATNG